MQRSKPLWMTISLYGGSMKTKALAILLVTLVLGGWVYYNFVRGPSGVSNSHQVSNDAVLPHFHKHFPKVLVVKALKGYKISDNKIEKITKVLALKEENVEKKARAIGASKFRNPFTVPPDVDDMLELLYNESFEIFTDTLKSNNITDQKIINGTFKQLQIERLKNFSEVASKKRKHEKKTK